MPDELEHELVEQIVENAIGRLRLTPSEKVLCTKGEMKGVIRQAAREAFEVGVLTARQERFCELTRSGSLGRPAWMDVPLNSQTELARHGVRLQPVVLRALQNAGYRCLGDLRWVSSRQLKSLKYIGLKTAGAIRAAITRLEPSEPRE